ncbi:MAG TPA: nitrite reductase (NAD(P)H) small subunit [Candidatus Binatia bacterium]
MDGFIKVANVGEIEPGKGMLFYHEGVWIAVFNSWGAYFAVEDRCPGCGASLAECEFKGTMITCPTDAAAFYLPAGTYMGPGEMKPLTSFRVWIDREQIKVRPTGVEQDMDDRLSTAWAQDLYGSTMRLQ